MADRARREGLRDGPVRLAGDVRGGRRADGARAVPPGPPDDRLAAARLRRRPPAHPRRPALRALPVGAARHLPRVVPAVRRGVRGQRPLLDAGPDGAAGRRAGRRRARPRCLGAGARPAAAPVAAARRHLLRPGGRHQVDGAVPDGGVRAAGLAVERGGAPLVRRPVAGAALGAGRRRPGVRAPRAGRPGGLRRLVERLAGARRRLRGGPVVDAVHPLRVRGPLRGRRDRQRARRGRVAHRHRAGRTGPRRGHPVAAVALVLPPGRLHLPRPLPELQRARLRLEAVGLAAAQPSGRASPPTPPSSRARRAATRPRAATACARCCCSARR